MSGEWLVNAMRGEACPICTPGASLDGYQFCDACEARYPAVLLKACVDPFDYAVGLRNGAVIRFAEAGIDTNSGWVELRGLGPGSEAVEGLPFPCPRGVEVRLDDIVWLADAPEGS